MKVRLASAPHHDTFGYSMPPPGLLRLGAALHRADLPFPLELELDDLAFRLASGALPGDDSLAAAAAARLCRGGPPTVLGLSVMGATLPIALAIAREVRAIDASVRIVLGGPGAHGVDRAVIERFAWIDAVVRGEGEETLPELLGAWAAGRDADAVRGVTWRDASGRVVREPERPAIRDLDALGPTDWSLLPPIADYKAITAEPEGLVPIDSGRGCVYDCSFCTIGRYWDRRSRTLSPAALVRELEALRSLPAARSAYLCHDIFGADRAHALASCAALDESGLRVPWECRARADHLDRELLRAMARAGCYRVLLGIESADPGVRRANQKGMRDDVDLLGVVADCAAARITPILSLILGLPGEDEDALRRSLDFCASASLLAGVNLSLHLPNPQPGCALGEVHGARSRPVEGIPPDMAWGAGETAPERAIRAAHPDLFTTWALLPTDEPRLRELHDLATSLPEVLMRYPGTFAVLRERGPEQRDALDLHRAWRADGRSFEAFAARHRDRGVDDCLRWEQARVRAGARGAHGGSLAPDPGVVPVLAGEVLELDHDVVAVLARERTGAGLDLPRRRTRLVVTRGERGVVTSRVGADVALVLARLDGTSTLAELDAAAPGLADAARRLARAGLVRFERPHARRDLAAEV